MVWLLLFARNLSSYEKKIQLEVSDTFTGTDAQLFKTQETLRLEGVIQDVNPPPFESCIKKRM